MICLGSEFVAVVLCCVVYSVLYRPGFLLKKIFPI